MAAATIALIFSAAIRWAIAVRAGEVQRCEGSLRAGWRRRRERRPIVLAPNIARCRRILPTRFCGRVQVRSQHQSVESAVSKPRATACNFGGAPEYVWRIRLVKSLLPVRYGVRTGTRTASRVASRRGGDITQPLPLPPDIEARVDRHHAAARGIEDHDADRRGLDQGFKVGARGSSRNVRVRARHPLRRAPGHRGWPVSLTATEYELLRMLSA